MNEKRLEGPGPLHRLDGALSACGWATQLELAYDRTRIKAPGWRIKEWDYYLVNDDEYAVALTVGDLRLHGPHLGLGRRLGGVLRTRPQASSHRCPMGRFSPAFERSTEGVTEFKNESRVTCGSK